MQHDPVSASLYSGPTRSILVVDDNPTALAVIGRRLGRLGYLAVLCDKATDALDQVATRRFDLVLADMVMPGMSGMQLLRALRASADTRELPVILLTSRSDPAAAVDALAAGADDHVAKPFDFDVLAARIERVIGHARRLAELRAFNAALDARIAERAIELGEAQTELAATRADRQRLVASLQALNYRVELAGC
ncbi:response regulator [Sphingomonas populi]|uniref:Response regulator n=1 Tax=Sphingomonas populi TaxID=2484750 RepID=A0A4V2DDN3_9SPHN|nr:response regulator [Sphingomonas populi]RZF65588.1 response regulator [Sphingomonas populi]